MAVVKKQDVRILTVITARGGSKGIPGKNIKRLRGQPLIAYTIQAADRSKYRKHMDVICSTDDAGIIRTVKRFGCDVPFVRPKYLADDKASSVDVILHAVKESEAIKKTSYTHILLLQPTSPLRTEKHIDAVLKILFKQKADSVVSVTAVKESPYLMHSVSDKGYMKPVIVPDTKITRRQDLPKVFRLNGAVYVIKKNAFLKNKNFMTSKTQPYVMDAGTSLDIDTMDDWQQAVKALKERAV